jgi:sec-independent protein translocase protein TatA
MFGLGFQEILLLLLIALLLFGAKKLPDIGRALGNTIREFKKAFSGEAREDQDKTNDHKPS